MKDKNLILHIYNQFFRGSALPKATEQSVMEAIKLAYMQGAADATRSDDDEDREVIKTSRNQIGMFNS